MLLLDSGLNYTTILKKKKKKASINDQHLKPPASVRVRWSLVGKISRALNCIYKLYFLESVRAEKHEFIYNNFSARVHQERERNSINKEPIQIGPCGL